MMTTTSAKDGICVIGNLNVDLLIRGVPALPAWGQEVVGVDHQSFSAGQAGYLALGLTALDTPTSVIGVVGDDEAGEQIIRSLADTGVGVSGITKIPGERTGITVALVRPDGERAFASDIGCSACLTEKQILSAMALVERASIVAVVGLFMVPQLPIPRIRALMAQCRQDGRRTALDTGWDPADWPAQTISDLRDLLSEVDLFLPNLDEARAITGETRPEAALERLSELCVGTVVIKCGTEGSLAWHAGSVLKHAARPVAVIDAVGAGDAFDAGLLAALNEGRPIQAAIAEAHAFASLYVSRASNRYARRSELAALFQTRTES